MSAGLPIVSTDHSGVPYTVRHEQEGLIVTPGDIDAIAAALARLIDDPERRNEMGESGRRRYEEVYAPAVFAERVSALLGAGV
jgi:glycosyltransferase involved in cell wall biosynthesis